jgi:hypothetical protein
MGAQSIPCLHACLLYTQVLQFFKLFLKQTHVVTNNIGNCLTDNSSVGFR